jgi:hypothetical protein
MMLPRKWQNRKRNKVKNAFFLLTTCVCLPRAFFSRPSILPVSGAAITLELNSLIDGEQTWEGLERLLPREDGVYMTIFYQAHTIVSL